jgi:aryl-alcohol dehydrogenase-like predicted oxidoreductase
LSTSLATSTRLGIPRYETLQPEYNLCEREGFENELQGLCVRETIGVITYFSLAKGFLTGKYRSAADLTKSPRGAGVERYLDERGLGILEVLDALSEEFRATPAQISIAWLLTRSAVTAAIASATSLPQLDELMAGVRLELTSTALDRLDAASAASPRARS